jgi:hypothetical protein
MANADYVSGLQARSCLNAGSVFNCVALPSFKQIVEGRKATKKGLSSHVVWWRPLEDRINIFDFQLQLRFDQYW